MKALFMGIGAICTAMMLSACGTMTKAECQVADWYQVGLSDGKTGKMWHHLADHAKSCAKAGIVPDKQAWEAGRQQGLQSYCTIGNAYQRGLKGISVGMACPAESQEILDKANRYGQAIHQLESDIDSKLRERKKLVEEYNKLRGGDMLKFQSVKEARLRMLALPSVVSDLDKEVAEYQSKLDYLRHHSPYASY